MKQIRRLLARFTRGRQASAVMHDAPPASEFQLGNWRFLARHARLHDPVRGRELTLTPRAARLLACLVGQPGVVLTPAELAALCGVNAAGHALTQAISELRQALRDGCDDAPCYIQTVPKRGYRLAVPVTSVTAGVRPVTWPGWRWLLFGALAASFGAILFMVVWPPRLSDTTAPPLYELPNPRRIMVVFELTKDERLNAQLVGLGSLAAYTIARYSPYEVVQSIDERSQAIAHSARNLQLRVVRVGQTSYLHALMTHQLREQVLLDKHYPLQLQAAAMTALAGDVLRALHQPVPEKLPGADTAADLHATELFYQGYYRFFKADAASLREAVRLLEEVRARYPTSPEVLAMLATSMLVLGDLATDGEPPPKRAEVDAVMAVLAAQSASPHYQNVLVYEARALYALYRGQPQQGLALMEAVLRKRDSWRAQVIRGKLAELAGQLDIAADAYARAWLLSPTSSTLLWIRQLAFKSDLAAVAPGLVDQRLYDADVYVK